MNLAWPDQSWSGPTWPDLAYLRSGQGPTWPNGRDATAWARSVKNDIIQFKTDDGKSIAVALSLDNYNGMQSCTRVHILRPEYPTRPEKAYNPTHPNLVGRV